MPRHLADERPCSECFQILPLENFVRNRSRKDGYMNMCKACQRDYIPKHTKRDLDSIVKTCACCGRSLSARMFVADQKADDKLSAKCRSCKSWRGRNEPTIEAVELFEATLRDILLTASERADPITERTLYENYFAKEFNKRRLSDKWKLPIWVNHDTLLD